MTKVIILQYYGYSLKLMNLNEIYYVFVDLIDTLNNWYDAAYIIDVKQYIQFGHKKRL